MSNWIVKWHWCDLYKGTTDKACCGNCYHWARLSSRCTAKKLVMEVYHIHEKHK
jgi:hypothetical protein